MSMGDQIVAALRAAANPSQEVRIQGEAQLRQLQSNPNAYFEACAQVFVTPIADTSRLFDRQLAGFQIKNHLRIPQCGQNPVIMRAVCTQAIADADRRIRNVASSMISLAVRESLWPLQDVIPLLASMLITPDQVTPAVQGAIRALSHITEDCIFLMDAQQMTGQVLQGAAPTLNPAVIAAAATSEEARSVVMDTLTIMNVVLEQSGLDNSSFSFQAMQSSVTPLIQACFGLLQNPPSLRVTAKCLSCLVLSLAFQGAIDNATFNQMAQLMLTITTSEAAPRSTEEEQVRMEATEFWRSVLWFPHFAELAGPAVQSLIPTLIKAMVYSDSELGMLQGQANDWQQPDRAEDIKPRHYQGRVQNMHKDDDEDGDDDDDEVEEWNLRRVSASVVDDISSYFGEPILMPVLTEINAMMQPGRPWKELEAAILALGAISGGCYDAMVPYLAQITQRLVALLKDETTHFLVVNITLWAMTQLGKFVLQTPALLADFITITLAKMQSPSKLVQESATAALESIIELSGSEDAQQTLAPFVPQMVQTIAQCMRGYQLKNRLLVLEAMETLCEVLDEPLRQSQPSVDVLLPALGELWGTTPDNSPLIFSVFSCMARVCSALGSAIQPMAENIFARAFNLMQHHMQLRMAAAQQPSQEEIDDDPEYVITSADMLSGLFDALGSSLEPLAAARQQPAFMEMVLAMVNDEDAQIRSSGFSLAGDAAKACPGMVQQSLVAMCTAAVANTQELTESNYTVISNVAWFLCNVLEYQLEIDGAPTLQQQPLATTLFQQLCVMLASAELTADMRNMAENITLYIGLSMYADPDILQRANCPLAAFAKRFCEYMRRMDADLPQKTVSLGAFLVAAQQEPQCVAQNLPAFVDLALSASSESVDIQRGIKTVLTQAQPAAGPAWQQTMQQLMASQRAALYQAYGLN